MRVLDGYSIILPVSCQLSQAHSPELDYPTKKDCQLAWSLTRRRSVGRVHKLIQMAGQAPLSESFPCLPVTEEGEQACSGIGLANHGGRFLHLLLASTEDTKGVWLRIESWNSGKVPASQIAEENCQAKLPGDSSASSSNEHEYILTLQVGRCRGPRNPIPG